VAESDGPPDTGRGTWHRRLFTNRPW
jgi:hypothetical protein